MAPKVSEFDLAFEGKDVPAEQTSATAPSGYELPPDFLSVVQALQNQLGVDKIDAEIVPPEEVTPMGQSVVAPGQEAPEGTQSQGEDWEQKYKSFQGSANAQLQQAAEREKVLLEEINRLQDLLAKGQGGSAEVPSQEESGGVPSEESIYGEDPEIKDFMETYPEIAKPIAKLVADSVKNTVSEVLTKVDKEKLAPLQDDIANFQRLYHFDRIIQAHPDAMDIVQSGDLEKWAKSQPPEIQGQILEIMEDGNADEVISLLSKYKESQQQGAPQPQPQPEGKEQPTEEQQAEPSQTEVPLSDKQAEQLSPEDMQKLSMIETVKRKGATQPKTSKAVDFDTAFEEAVRGLTNL